MKKLLALFLCLSLLCAMLSGCGSTAKQNKEPVPTVTFTDSAGREVEIPAEITAIAPSGSLAQMLLYTLCPDKLMGLCSSFSRIQKQYIKEDYWELPVFGQFYGSGGTVNYEEIIEAAPDIIIDIGEQKDTIVSDMDTLQEQTGIPVIFVEATLYTMPDAYETLGQILDCSERAETLASYTRNVLALAEENRAALDESQIVDAVYVQGEYGTEVNAKGSSHAEVLDVVGVNNLAVLEDFSGGGGDEVSMEQMLLWDPDVVLISPDGNFDDIYDDPQWQSATAVKNHDIYEVPIGPYNWLDRPPSMQRILGILWLGNLLYPDLYDFDMVEKTQEFYQLFWDYPLTVEEAEALLANSTLLAS